MEFRRALLRVSGEIGQKDLEKLKFACSDQVPDAKRETIHSPIELFLALEERGLLASNNLDYLARQLRHIGRPTLLSYFQQFGYHVPESAATHQQSDVLETPIEERLNKFLLFVSDKLTCSEVDRLAFAWCKGYLYKTPDQIHSAYQLFTLMSQRLAISADNLDVLYIELSEMGRQDLCRSIEEYYARYGIKQSLFPYHPLSNVSTPTGFSPCSTPYNHYGHVEFPSDPFHPSTPSDYTAATPTSGSSSSSSSGISGSGGSSGSSGSSGSGGTSTNGLVSSSSRSTLPEASVDNLTPNQNQPLPPTHHPVPRTAALERKPEFVTIPEGSLMRKIYKKQQELDELKSRLDLEQNQQRLNSTKNPGQADHHQHQVLMLQDAYTQKNHEMQELYKEFMDQNIMSMKGLSLSQLPEAEYYPMSCHPHGYCVIFNNHEFYQVEDSHEQLMDRGGAEIDQKTLAETFKFLQYNVEVYENLSSREIISTMKQISSRDHSRFDSFICCILTHGEEGKIFGSDSLPVNLQDLTGLMKGTYCASLVNKPKLFFIQACRGEKEDKGIPIEKDGDSSLPVEADYLFGYATPTGKAAYRSRRHGSWFISELCNVFMNNAHVMGLSSMMKKVNRSVSEAYTKEGYKQCTEVVDRLRREVKFLPSYPQNSTP